MQVSELHSTKLKQSEVSEQQPQHATRLKQSEVSK